MPAAEVGTHTDGGAGGLGGDSDGGEGGVRLLLMAFVYCLLLLGSMAIVLRNRHAIETAVQRADQMWTGLRWMLRPSSRRYDLRLDDREEDIDGAEHAQFEESEDEKAKSKRNRQLLRFCESDAADNSAEIATLTVAVLFTESYPWFLNYVVPLYFGVVHIYQLHHSLSSVSGKGRRFGGRLFAGLFALCLLACALLYTAKPAAMMQCDSFDGRPWMCSLLDWALTGYAVVAFIFQKFALGSSELKLVCDDDNDDDQLQRAERRGEAVRPQKVHLSYFWLGRAQEAGGTQTKIILGANAVAHGFLLPYFCLERTLENAEQQLEQKFGRLVVRLVVCRQDESRTWCVDRTRYDAWLRQLDSEVASLFSLVHPSATDKKGNSIITILLVWYAIFTAVRWWLEAVAANVKADGVCAVLIHYPNNIG